MLVKLNLCNLCIRCISDTERSSVIKHLQVISSSKLPSDQIRSTRFPKLPESLPSHSERELEKPQESNQEYFQELLLIFYAACYQDKPRENLAAL